MALGFLAACGAPVEGIDAGETHDARVIEDDASPPRDGGRDAGPELDGGRDAGRDAGPDAGRDAGRDAGPSCVLGTVTSCDSSDRPRSCRIYGAEVFCGVVSLAPRNLGDSCDSIEQCDQTLQCLRMTTSSARRCRRLCEIGVTICPASTECIRPVGLVAHDDTPITMPAGFGVCD